MIGLLWNNAEWNRSIEGYCPLFVNVQYVNANRHLWYIVLMFFLRFLQMLQMGNLNKKVSFVIK